MARKKSEAAGARMPEVKQMLDTQKKSGAQHSIRKTIMEQIIWAALS
jgi:hypothetical protein